jgi:hypothetical protein
MAGACLLFGSNWRESALIPTRILEKTRRKYKGD